MQISNGFEAPSVPVGSGIHGCGPAIGRGKWSCPGAEWVEMIQNGLRTAGFKPICVSIRLGPFLVQESRRWKDIVCREGADNGPPRAPRRWWSKRRPFASPPGWICSEPRWRGHSDACGRSNGAGSSRIDREERESTHRDLDRPVANYWLPESWR
jgi:hypothetical protein